MKRENGWNNLACLQLAACSSYNFSQDATEEWVRIIEMLSNTNQGLFFESKFSWTRTIQIKDHGFFKAVNSAGKSAQLHHYYFSESFSVNPCLADQTRFFAHNSWTPAYAHTASSLEEKYRGEDEGKVRHYWTGEKGKPERVGRGDVHWWGKDAMIRKLGKNFPLV